MRYLKLLAYLAVIGLMSLGVAGCGFFGGDGKDDDTGGGDGGGGKSGTITIKNNTGYSLEYCQIKSSTSSDWKSVGGSSYSTTYYHAIKNGESYAYEAPFEISDGNEFDVKLSSTSGGKKFAKYNISMSKGVTVTLTDSDDNESQNPTITIKNQSGITFDKCFIKPSSASDDDYDYDFIASSLGMSNNGEKSITLPFSLQNYSEFDIQMRSSSPANTYTKKNVSVSDGVRLTYYNADSDNLDISKTVIVVENNAGYEIRYCQIKPSTSSDWKSVGGSSYSTAYYHAIKNGESYAYEAPFEISDGNEFDIKLSSTSGGKKFSKSNVSMSKGVIVNLSDSDEE